MTLLFFLKPANSMIVGPHEWDPDYDEFGVYIKKKHRRKKRKEALHFERLIREDEELLLLLMGEFDWPFTTGTKKRAK